MNKQGVTSNDILEALSIRINDTIRPNRNKEKKNNAYFWIFKFVGYDDGRSPYRLIEPWFTNSCGI